MKRILLYVSLAVLVVMGTGCPDHHGDESESEILDLIRQMVVAYLEGDYDLAREKADRIVELAPNSSEPYAVRGLIFMAQDSLDQAREQLNIAIGKPEGDRDHAYVGRAMLSREVDCSTTVEDGKRVLTATPDYRLPAEWMEVDPDPPIVLTADHIKLLMAQCQYLGGQFGEALATAKSMSPSRTGPVGIDNLSPDSPATWVVGQKAFGTYEAALGAALQALEGSVT